MNVHVPDSSPLGRETEGRTVREALELSFLPAGAAGTDAMTFWRSSDDVWLRFCGNMGKRGRGERGRGGEGERGEGERGEGGGGRGEGGGEGRGRYTSVVHVDTYVYRILYIKLFGRFFIYRRMLPNLSPSPNLHVNR